MGFPEARCLQGYNVTSKTFPRGRCRGLVPPTQNIKASRQHPSRTVSKQNTAWNAEHAAPKSRGHGQDKNNWIGAVKLDQPYTHCSTPNRIPAPWETFQTVR